jgi:outer membrane lipoprotein SlyB
MSAQIPKSNTALGGFTMPGAIAGSMMGTAHMGAADVHQFRGLDLRITAATGGYIVSIQSPNQYGRDPELYIVHEDQDLGLEIGKIITIHYLKKD